MLRILVLACIVQMCIAIEQRAWMQTDLDPAQRAQLLLPQMTLREKVDMCHGGPQDENWTGNIAGNSRLGIPRVQMNDGPQGFGDDQHLTTTTAWPSSLTMAASWDVKAMHQWANGMGEEFWSKGASMQLGPGVNLARVPHNGRNFEYISGEDPFLGFTLVQPVVRGIQGNGVMAVAKHFVCNNQEFNRRYISANVDERTRFEFYYAPFEGAIRAGVASIMTSYNRINDVWASENNQTIAIDLKQRLGFKGFVMSDWSSMHSTSIVAGMDMEMPFGEFMGDPLLQAVQNGTIAESYVDDSVLRTLTQMFAIGLFDEINPNVRANNGSSVEHVDLARHLSVQSTVLLKNDAAPPPAYRQNDDPAPLLPLNINDPLLTLAVLGWADRDSCFTVGNGSGEVNPTRIVSPLEALVARFGGDQSRVLFQPNISDIAAAVALAQRSTVSIIFVGEQSREGHDRHSLSIRAPGDDLIAAVVKAQPRTVVVMASPGAMLTPWRDAVPAVLCNFMPGQEVGNAIAEILFGDANPSGKLPVTMPIGENDQKFTPSQYPGLPTALPLESNYIEGPFFGYRWYQQNSLQPAFPFGHGLSYTKFEYSNLVIAHRVVTFNITNIGTIAGAEVPQLYLHFPDSAPPPMPHWQLRGFAKVQLAPNESATVQLPLTDNRWLSIWDAELHEWQFVHGQYEVAIGASSEDFRLTGTFQI